MKIPFKYSVDDDYDSGERVYIMLDGLEEDLPEDVDVAELVDKILNKGLWYRVELSCTLDTETGTITVEDVKV